jgi:P27 family predicted phage terminase small subunit
MHLKLVRGNPGKRRLNPEPLPQLPAELEPPPILLEEAKAEWKRVGPELLRLGLLTVLDLAAFGAYCQAYGRWLEAERALVAAGTLVVKTARGGERVNPLLRIATEAMGDMLKFGSEFGMTPASRTRLGSVEPPGGGKFEGLLST